LSWDLSPTHGGDILRRIPLFLALCIHEIVLKKERRTSFSF